MFLVKIHRLYVIQLWDSPKDNTEATAYNTEFWTYIMKQVLPYMGIEKTEKE